MYQDPWKFWGLIIESSNQFHGRTELSILKGGNIKFSQKLNLRVLCFSNYEVIDVPHLWHLEASVNWFIQLELPCLFGRRSCLLIRTFFLKGKDTFMSHEKKPNQHKSSWEEIHSLIFIVVYLVLPGTLLMTYF